MNAVEQEIEKLKLELKSFQTQYVDVSAEKRRLKYKIQCKLQEIVGLEKSQRLVPPNLVERDIELCIAFIRKNKQVTSKQLIDYLNVALIGQELRWPANKPLDSNYFMSRVGSYLKKLIHVGFDSNGKGEGGRKTTIFYIK